MDATQIGWVKWLDRWEDTLLCDTIDAQQNSARKK